MILKTLKYHRGLLRVNDTIKDARLLIYQEPPDISGIFLTPVDAQSLHP